MHDPALLSLLDGFDAETYLRALIAVVKIDGIKVIERDYIETRAKVLGVDTVALWEEELKEFPPIPEEVSEVTRRVIVRDCILLGCIDGEYTDAERAWVHRIATWLSVDIEASDRLEDWLRRYFDLMEEQEMLLSGFDPPFGDPRSG